MKVNTCDSFSTFQGEDDGGEEEEEGGVVMTPRFLSRPRRSNSPHRYRPPSPRRHSNRHKTNRSPRRLVGRVCARSILPAWWGPLHRLALRLL